MRKYMYLGTYTGEGIKGVAAEGGTAREEATRALFENLGGRITEYSFMFGAYDFVIIADMPDHSAALVPPMMAGSTGTVRVMTVELLPPAVLDDASRTAKGLAFRAAGH